MQNITLDYSKTLSVTTKNELDSMKEQICEAHTKLMNQTGAGNSCSSTYLSDLIELVKDNEGVL